MNRSKLDSREWKHHHAGYEQMQINPQPQQFDQLPGMYSSWKEALKSPAIWAVIITIAAIISLIVFVDPARS